MVRKVQRKFRLNKLNRLIRSFGSNQIYLLRKAIIRWKESHGMKKINECFYKVCRKLIAEQ